LESFFSDPVREQLGISASGTKIVNEEAKKNNPVAAG